MNWRLLDIRVGRTNRMQFCISLLLFFLLGFAAFTFSSYGAAVILLGVCYYFLMIVAVRRIHDMGEESIGLKLLLGWSQALIIMTMILDQGLPYLKRAIGDGYLAFTFVFIFMLLAGIALTGILIFKLFEKDSLSETNRYGEKPEGFNLFNYGIESK